MGRFSITEGKCYYLVYQKPFNTYSYTNFSSKVIDLCTFRSEIIHDSPEIRFCIAVRFDLTSQF